ncbi:MAG: helix-turn-helix domain-containing protein [Chloroflexi bacterium]|nr:helix-turn-helix domain-containing protein [Chloroflexota bacterium]
MPDMIQNDSETLTTPEVLLELGISRKTLYKWMDRGIIRPNNFNPLFEKQSKLLFLKSDVQSVKEQMRPPAPNTAAS